MSPLRDSTNLYTDSWPESTLPTRHKILQDQINPFLECFGSIFNIENNKRDY